MPLNRDEILKRMQQEGSKKNRSDLKSDKKIKGNKQYEDKSDSDINISKKEMNSDKNAISNSSELKSEQCPSVVSCGVLVEVDYSIKAAGAIIIQLLPNFSEEDLIYLEKIAHKFENISTKISENKDYKDIILPYFDDFEVLMEKELHYHCDCHKEKFIRSLLTLSREDLNDLFK